MSALTVRVASYVGGAGTGNGRHNLDLGTIVGCRGHIHRERSNVGPEDRQVVHIPLIGDRIAVVRAVGRGTVGGRGEGHGGIGDRRRVGRILRDRDRCTHGVHRSGDDGALDTFGEPAGVLTTSPSRMAKFTPVAAAALMRRARRTGDPQRERPVRWFGAGPCRLRRRPGSPTAGGTVEGLDRGIRSRVGMAAPAVLMKVIMPSSARAKKR